ncbi:MAG: Rid family hydrolase [Solirubrobacteraceae bacterium]
MRDGTAFERTAGYSRAVQMGGYVAVSGTAALGPDGVALHPGDAYLQTKAALSRALEAAEQLGAPRERIIRTRLLLTPGCDWREAAKAHGELLGGVDPANTTVFVGALIPEGCVVEVEVDGVVQ